MDSRLNFGNDKKGVIPDIEAWKVNPLITPQKKTKNKNLNKQKKPTEEKVFLSRWLSLY